jgi:branched-chain amino acid transport system ATP-binding protein
MSLSLRTELLSRRFGGFAATREVNLEIAPGARQALIGPNGAGKTTLINLLTGHLAPSSGSIFLGEQDITRLPAHRRVKAGIARTFQINALFERLSPLESVALAIAERDGFAAVFWRRLASYRGALDEARALLDTLNLGHFAEVPTAHLPYGKQRLLEIALALALKPRILLLDEPAAGVPGGESEELFEVIGALPPTISILFIEHDMNLVFRFATRISVLVAGHILVEGTPAAIAGDPRVREVYLGKQSHV